MKQIFLGTVGKSFGIKGAVCISLLSNSSSATINSEFTLHMPDGSQKQVIVKDFLLPNRFFFEGITNKNDADKLKAAKVYTQASNLPKLNDDEYYLSEIENFLVVDEEKNSLGTIVAFSSNGYQDLLEIKNNKGDVFYVPLVKELVVSIDFDKQFVVIKALEGWF